VLERCNNPSPGAGLPRIGRDAGGASRRDGMEYAETTMAGPHTFYTVLPSPIGDLLLVGDGAGLTGIYLSPHTGGPTVGADWALDPRPFADAARQLDEYFAGERTAFDLPLAPAGTPFQLSVWQALRRVPYGETTSYGRLALELGRPGAARAVGLANGRNPLSIVVPCHRVVGSDGRLVGYAGGLERKRQLLAMEARVRACREGIRQRFVHVGASCPGVFLGRPQHWRSAPASEHGEV